MRGARGYILLAFHTPHENSTSNMMKLSNASKISLIIIPNNARMKAFTCFLMSIVFFIKNSIGPYQRFEDENVFADIANKRYFFIR